MRDFRCQRSGYLCRSFDQLYRGEQYASTTSVLHIGILDFNLFPKNPKFYASYKLMDMENSYIYNDKFELRVLELKHINLPNLTLWYVKNPRIH